MAAEFEVHRGFVLEGRSVFVLAGVITEGMVQIGMHATLPSAENVFSARVHGVEFLDETSGQVEHTEPALTFSYSRPEKVQRWQKIDWAGKKLRLEW